MAKALIAMSGGVDSSVAMYLMQQKGYETVGVTMHLYENWQAGVSEYSPCCSQKDIEDAKNVAATFGSDHIVINYMEEFRKHVIDNFVKTYMDGATPNPCIECNRHLKFDALFKKAEELGCEKVVTGHYATVEYISECDEYYLKRAEDDTKDQTYVLYFLGQDKLSKLVFPLGEHKKNEARDIAEEQSIITARKHDSQDICFVPDHDYSRVIKDTLKYQPELGKLPGDGNFVDKDGNVMGRHGGYYRYTVGQRKGLGISSDRPLYVVEIRPSSNEVVLGREEDLYTTHVHAEDFVVINTKFPDGTEIPDRFEVTAKVRYGHKEAPGRITVNPDGSADMEFDEPVRAVVRGQSLVIYRDRYCLGGGRIS